jgi:hypothetical protein
MPEYWEACKAHYRALVFDKWEKKFLGDLFGEELEKKVQIA